MGNAESTTDGSRELFVAAKKGDAAEVARLNALGAGLEYRDAKLRTPLLAAVALGHRAACNQLLRLGADVHVTARSGDMGTPLHVACTAGDSTIIDMLLAAGASPFLAHGDATPLDAAAAAGDVALTRRLEAMGTFSGWCHVKSEPNLLNGGLLNALLGRELWKPRWVAVVPRYRASALGVVCTLQLRLSRSQADALPSACFDILGAQAALRGVVAVSVLERERGSEGGIARVVELAVAVPAGSVPDAAAAAAAAASLVAACNNRTPPRVPVVGPRRALPPSPPDAPPPRQPVAAAFPSPPSAPAPQPPPPPPPPLPPRRPPPSPPQQQQPPGLRPTSSADDPDIAEAIRRSLADVALPTPSAPPLPADAAAAAPPAASPVQPPPAVEDDDDAMCVVCLSAPRSAGLLHGSSMHVVACADCAPHLAGKPCPMCRAHVERVVPRIYR